MSGSMITPWVSLWKPGKCAVEGLQGAEVAQHRPVGGAGASPGMRTGMPGGVTVDHGGGHPARRVGEAHAFGAAADERW